MSDEYVPTPFRCEVSSLGGVTRVRPEGDLDMGTVEELDRVLEQARGDGARRIVVDLRGLSFMDSTGITLLARWNSAASRDGFDLALVQGHERIARLFSLTGLREYFTFEAG